MKLISNYLKNLLYYILELISNIINILLALLGIQYSLNLGVEFLTMLEVNRINKEIFNRQEYRDKLEMEAKAKEEEAKVTAVEIE